MRTLEQSRIANIFKSCRSFHKLHQSEVAKILHVSQGAVSKAELGICKIELKFWFNFLKAFNIQDPYCFTYDAFELDESVFNNLKREGSSLAPQFKFFDESYVFRIKLIRPVFDFLQIFFSEELDAYLKKNKIKIHIFYILNHPVPLDLLDSFFLFLEGMKIDIKSLPYLNLCFDAAFGRQLETMPRLNLSDVFRLLKNDNQPFSYRLNKDKNYIGTLKTEFFEVVKAMKSYELFMEFNLLLPYFLYKSKVENQSQFTSKSEVLKNKQWEVVYT